jgi:hypothetical protein
MFCCKEVEEEERWGLDVERRWEREMVVEGAASA